MLIDTHCHLDAAEFFADRDALVLAARSAGVGAIVVPSVDAGNWEAVHDCCQRFPGLFPAYGIHPLYVDGVAESAMRNLREWLAAELKSANPPVAVGEIGLDFFRLCSRNLWLSMISDGQGQPLSGFQSSS